jgi:hypothetical protein
MKSQQPDFTETLTDMQKGILQKYTSECPDVTDTTLKTLLDDLNIPVTANRSLNCVNMQMGLLDKNSKNTEFVSDVIKMLKLPTSSSPATRINTIKLFLNIHKFFIKQGTKNIIPTPNTFILEKNGKEFYLACPNNHPSGSKKVFMGFIKLDQNPDINTVQGDAKRKFCAPCCRERIDSARVNFCSGVITHEEYTNPNKTGNNTYVLSANPEKLDIGRFGNLPPSMSMLLNNTRIITALQKSSEYYLKLGIDNPDLLGCIQQVTGIENLLEKMSDAVTDIIFKSLGDGTVSWMYTNDITTFKLQLSSANIPDDILWELLQLPNVLSVTGVNILMTEMINNDSHVICPMYSDVMHWYSSEKPTIILFRTKDLQYNPVVLTTKTGTWEGIFDNLNSVFDTLKKWGVDSCSANNNSSAVILTAKSLIKRIPGIVLQIIDVFNKVKLLVTEDNTLIPCVMSGIDTTIDIIEYPLYSIKRYEQSYSQTLSRLRLMPDFTDFTFTHLDNFLIIQELNISVPVTDSANIKKRKIIDSMIKLDVEIAKNTGKSNSNVFDQIKTQVYHEESYDMYKYMFSMSISGTKNILEQLRSFNSNIVTIPDLPDLRNYTKTNIRGANTSIYHFVDNNFVVFADYLPRFTRRITQELRYPIMADPIVYKRIPRIIDQTAFYSVDNNTTYLGM